MHSNEEFMRLAISIGRLALPDCLPNPPVGCVLVKNGEVISLGYTQSPGKHHAEAMALESLPSECSGVTAYVTLEPCSFYGRTPSCAKALVERNIERVFIALMDSDPKNSGAGVDLLCNAGTEVSVGLLADEAYADLAEFLICG